MRYNLWCPGMAGDWGMAAGAWSTDVSHHCSGRKHRATLETGLSYNPQRLHLLLYVCWLSSISRRIAPPPQLVPPAGLEVSQCMTFPERFHFKVIRRLKQAFIILWLLWVMSSEVTPWVRCLFTYWAYFYSSVSLMKWMVPLYVRESFALPSQPIQCPPHTETPL